MSNYFDVVIVGAGAAGLMCAATAGKRGRKVLVLEKANKIGKKILMSGGGKCNFTNYTVEPEHYICHNPHFVISALSRYTNWDFIGLVSDYAIRYEERKHGQLFTLDGSKHILDLLLDQCTKTNQVDIRASISVEKVTFDAQKKCYEVTTNSASFSCQSLVIASGGLSIPTLGGSDIGYKIAKQFGHHVYPTRAGLVPFTFSDQFKDTTTKLSGNAIEATLSNQKISFTEALLFTHRGLSGPSSLQLSNYWNIGESFDINFLLQIEAASYLLHKKSEQPKILIRTALLDFFPKSVVLELQHWIWQAQSELPLNQINDQTLQKIGETINAFSVKPSGTEGYRTAEVTLGGVDTNEVSSKTMQSHQQAGLYFIGEILDVSGWLGGYNFQWAWSSGVAAGEVA